MLQILAFIAKYYGPSIKILINNLMQEKTPTSVQKDIFHLTRLFSHIHAFTLKNPREIRLRNEPIIGQNGV